MDRMTLERVNGIKTGYWSPNKKEELVQRLAAYENTGLEPRHVQELLKKLKKLQLKSCEDIEPASKEFLDECREVAKKYRKKNDGWIPVDKRDHMPEAGEHVLVSIGTGFNPEKAFLSEDRRWMMLHAPAGYNDITDMVEAWMPLPEPYKPERRGEE